MRLSRGRSPHDSFNFPAAVRRAIALATTAFTLRRPPHDRSPASGPEGRLELYPERIALRTLDRLERYVDVEVGPLQMALAVRAGGPPRRWPA